jgi:hypothetical protein
MRYSIPWLEESLRAAVVKWQLLDFISIIG